MSCHRYACTGWGDCMSPEVPFLPDSEFYDLAHNQPDRALEIVAERLGPFLFAKIRPRVFSQQEAEDCLQEAMLLVARDLHKYRTGGSPVGWVLTRANWALLNFRQALAREKELPEIAPADPPGTSPVADETRIAARKAAAAVYLAGLPEPKSKLFEMRIVLGWSHAEIAAEIGSSEVAVRKAASRLLADFRSLLGQQGLWP